MGDRAEDWFRCFRPVPGARARLVCLPYACGSASFYGPWSPGLPDGVELVAVQYPGHEDRIRERCLRNLRVLADRVAEAIGELDATPVLLFGHSLGAAVAFEVALRLPDMGIRPAGLILSGRPAPQTVAEAPAPRTDDELWAELASAGGTRPEVVRDQRLRRFFLPILRADYQMSTTYRWSPGDRVHCDVVAYRGVADKDAGHAAVARWAELTTGTFRIRDFDGGHFYLNPPNPGLAECLREDIAALLDPTAEVARG
jgi:pyochelin biosynthetic protein PchC